MKKTEKDILEKDGLLYFNTSNQIFPSKQQIAPGYSANVNFYKIAVAVLSLLVLLSIFYFVERTIAI